MQNGRPEATFNHKFSRFHDSLNIFLCIATKFIPYIYIHFTNSSDELEIGQDLDRNQVMAAKIGHYFCNIPVRNIWETGPNS